MAISQMSNSLPRTMRRNAAMSGSTSSKWNAKLRGFTVPSLSARLLPWVRVTVLSFSSCMARRAALLFVVPVHAGFGPCFHRDDNPGPLYGRGIKPAASHRRLCHAGTRGEGLFGSIFEGQIGRQDDGGRAHPVMRRVDAGRRDAFLRGDEIFLGAVADRSHALLQRGILDRKAGNTAECLARFLSRAINQVVIVLIRERSIGAGDIFAMHACPLAHGVDFSARERADGVKVVAPGPAILVINWSPEVAVDRMIAARGDHGEARHHPRRNAPIVIAVLGVAPGADIESAWLLHDLKIGLNVGEVVFIALGALEQRIGPEVAAMQEGHMARVDASLHGLQPIAFLKALGDEALLGGNGGELPFRQRRLLLGRPHISPQHRPALHQGIGFELDLLAEATLARLRGNVDTLAGHVVFPAMIGAAQAGLFVTREPERNPAVGAELVDQSIPAFAVAEGKQPFGQELDAYGWAIILRQLLEQ